MVICFNKNMSYAVFWGLLLVLIDAGWSRDIKSFYDVSQPLVLHTLSVSDRYCEYDSVNIFVDSDRRVMVLCSYDNQQKNLLFGFNGQKWIQSVSPSRQAMMNKDVFQVYKTEVIDENNRSIGWKVSIYALNSDMQLPSLPTETLEIHDGKGVLKIGASNFFNQLLPVQDKPKRYFILGSYTENSSNPVDLIGRAVTYGHWGFVGRLYGAVVREKEITGFDIAPGVLRSNERMGDGKCIVSGDKIRWVGIKYREYRNDSKAIEYLEFDISKNQWSKPIELVKVYSSTEKEEQFLAGSPSLACNNENIYCAWSFKNAKSVKNNTSISSKESGVYFCSKINDQWDKPAKIADSGDNPQVVIDNSNVIHLFWLEEGEGLFHKSKTDIAWSSTDRILTDNRVHRPLCTSVDKDNNLHIIYIRERLGDIRGKAEFKPEEIVYVRLKL